MHCLSIRLLPALALSLLAVAPGVAQVVIPLSPPSFQFPNQPRRLPVQRLPVQPSATPLRQNPGRGGRRRPTGPVVPPPLPGDSDEFVNSAPTLGANGLLYVSSWNHQLQALDSKTGALRWKFVTGDILNTSPTLGTNGTVYLTSRDKNVYALDAMTGAKKWSFATGGPLNTRPAYGGSGLLYVGTFGKRVVALDAKTGEKRWERATEGIPSSPVLGSDDTVYVSANNLYALNGKTGAIQWSRPLAVLPSQAPAVGANGTVYVGTADAQILALNGVTGDTLWSFSTGHSVDYPLVMGPDDILYASAQKLFAIRASNGKERWERSGGGSAWSAPVIGDNGMVYAGYNDSQVYALDATTGRTKWQFVTNDGLLCFPSLGLDGLVYFQCQGDSKVYAVNRGTGQPRWVAAQDPLPSSVKPVVAEVPRGTR